MIRILLFVRLFIIIFRFRDILPEHDSFPEHDILPEPGRITQAGLLPAFELLIEELILFSGNIPGIIRSDRTAHDASPGLLALEVNGLCIVDRIEQKACIITVEGEAVSGLFVFVVGLDRIL